MLLALLALGVAAAALAAPEADLPCEKLGTPLVARDLALEAVTKGADGQYTVWGRYETAERNAAVGLPLAGGEAVWVDTTKYGRGHVFMTTGADGNLYLYTGTPGHFLRYDVTKGELTDLGSPAQPASYWMGQYRDPQGRWYIGTFPGVHVVCCDTRTGETKAWGPLAEDQRQQYVIRVAVSDQGMIYAAVGLHHRELWVVDPASGAKRQLLPAEMTQAQGAPDVWTAADGQVYGRSEGKEFRCHPDRLEFGPTAPARPDPERLKAGADTVLGLNPDGQLRLRDATGAERTVPTQYAGRPVTIFSVGCEYQGKLWGGGLFPGLLWSFDPATGKLQNHGMMAAGAIQIYDLIGGDEGLYLASYMGCHLDLYRPDQPRRQGENPFRIAGSVPGQERPNQWERGPDGKLYFGTTPAKGRLGGALVQVDPATRKWRQWPCPLPNLSLTHLAAIPETGELLVCCSIGGGSSAIPTEQEAAVYLWDPVQEKMTWSGKPVPGTRSYWRAVRLRDGRVFGVTGDQYYVFDPVKRLTLATGPLPVKALAFPTLNDEPVGEQGLVYGIGEGAVFAFDPAANAVRIVGRHPSLTRAHGFLVTGEGVLYYGSGADLWRCVLPR